jgi:pilus assembly protein Flp/PilA
MKKMIRMLWKDEEGATMVEYGLMVALIAVVCITVVTTLGTTLEGKFQAVVNAL